MPTSGRSRAVPRECEKRTFPRRSPAGGIPDQSPWSYISQMITWGDTVLVSDDAPEQLRPGCFASVVGISTEDQRAGGYLERFPSGTVYTIEFGDGSDAEVHESMVSRATE